MQYVPKATFLEQSQMVNANVKSATIVNAPLDYNLIPRHAAVVQSENQDALLGALQIHHPTLALQSLHVTREMN